MYGSAELMTFEVAPSPFFVPFRKVPFPKQRLNINAFAACILLPWLLFTVLSGTIAFFGSIHPELVVWYTFCGFVATGCFVLRLWITRRNWRNKSEEIMPEEGPSWLLFLCVAMFVAFALGLVIGTTNAGLMATYQAAVTLGHVRDVDPMEAPSAAFMDAGTITFINGSHVDTSRSLAYRNGRNYCVAPIVSGKLVPARWDFWAVGTDCCDPYGGSFTCGEANNLVANTGYLLMQKDLAPFYMIATQQAAAQYTLVTQRPVFFTWGLDPSTDAGRAAPTHSDRVLETVRRRLMIACFLHFVFQVASVCVALSFYEGREQ
eukprot:TRINITY_DN61605_c0_g1_i1.p1 TRINITY_DN61605_c0_g1~~TRINITY_DN61605_c0_g1_i1.p1  ORF type:complete len:319 (-),score=40.22 TRINITY_DN61605_c0_g1_i1:41-997(-)